MATLTGAGPLCTQDVSLFAPEFIGQPCSAFAVTLMLWTAPVPA